MNRSLCREMGSDHGASRVPARATRAPVEERLATTSSGGADIDLLRLSYVCRADAMLCGLPQRSAALARIHRFFDRAPRGVALDDLLWCALVGAAHDDEEAPCTRTRG